MAKANGSAKANGKANGFVKEQARSSKSVRPHGKELDRDHVGHDRLGRRIHKNSMKALEPTQFPPGQSGNPGGSYRSRPFTAAIAQVCEMKLSQLRPAADDLAPVALVKATFLAGLKGKVPAMTELADRFEGRATQRMQFENVPGTTFNVEQKVEGTVKVEHDASRLIETVRQFYGLSGHTYSRKSLVAVPVPERLDSGQQPPEDRDEG